MKIATPDLVTNSYFPALAAEELGVYRDEGLDAHVELLPSLDAVNALRDGAVDFVAGGAHTMLLAFPNWKGAKLVVTLSQGTPWLLVLRADLPARRGDVGAVKGLRIGAAPGPDRAFMRLLHEAGHYTFAALSTTDALIAREPERVAAVVRAIVRAQQILKKEPARATEVGRRRFPPAAADIIAAVVERDLPFYDPRIDERAVTVMNGFAQTLGLLTGPVSYESVVATRFRSLWNA